MGFLIPELETHFLRVCSDVICKNGLLFLHKSTPVSVYIHSFRFSLGKRLGGTVQVDFAAKGLPEDSELRPSVWPKEAKNAKLGQTLSFGLKLCEDSQENEYGGYMEKTDAESQTCYVSSGREGKSPRQSRWWWGLGGAELECHQKNAWPIPVLHHRRRLW